MQTLLHALPASLAAEAPPLPPFSNASEAWLWAVEVLRRRRLPSNSGRWLEQVSISASQRAALATERALEKINLAAEASQVAAQWGSRFKPELPRDAQGRLSLALQIQTAVGQLAAPEHKILQLWGWGDWADEAQLRGALAQQEKLRQQGVRARISYRYSLAQLALLLGCSKATAWRQLQAALSVLERKLAQLEITPLPPSPAPKHNALRPVKLAEFKR